MKTLATLLLILLFLIGCNHQKETSDISDGNPSYSQVIEARIERIIENLQVRTAIEVVYESKSLLNQMKYYNTPGVSIAVINKGKIEWARGFGKRDLTTNAVVDTRSLFEAGSVSKPVFALAVMRLKEKGVLDLDKNVNEYLMSWKVPSNGDWQAKITLRQLLSHTAGLTVHGFPGYLASEPVPTVPQILDGIHPANTPAVRVNILPGTIFRYSGGGTTVAQLTVEDKIGKPFPTIIKEELFGPLELKYSTYQQPLPTELEDIAATAYPYKNQPIKGRFHTYPEMAAAGLWTNPTELATLLIEVQKSVKGQSSLFKKETIEEMLTPQKVAKHIGIGFFLGSKGDSIRFGHEGWDEGFVTNVVAYKHLGIGAVIMVNSNEGYPLLEEIMRAIVIEYNWPDYLPPPPEFVNMNPEIEDHVGIYSLDENEIQITTIGNSLALTYENQDPILLRETTEGAFRNDQLNFSIAFKEDKFELIQNGQTFNYKMKTTHDKR